MPALVIGAGPAGLMAAEQLARCGLPVLLAEAKPSPARKFLMAGKSGLNLTKDESIEEFKENYGDATDWLTPILDRFGPKAVCAWAESLGQPVFTGSSGRVFPRSMKASPLLRNWLQNLGNLGVRLQTRWRWTGFQGKAFLFDTPEGRIAIHAQRCVLALGGNSWARLGSDGAWVPWLAAKGVSIAPFKPSNMGFQIDWSAKMTPFLGKPVKNIVLRTGHQESRGEVVISARGIEGGGLYPLSAALRDGAELTVDLFPAASVAEIAQRLARRPDGESTTNKLRKALRLQGARQAIFLEFAQPLPRSLDTLAARLKALPVALGPPRPIDEAISVAGGVCRDAVDSGLMLRNLPGVFVAGEMLDWDAPTGGYLLTACLATGLHAGRHAAAWSASEASGTDNHPSDD
ncbi:MAG: TIGR03862 family flavoprotein [Pararhodobacter sp.]|nr:TIGR03862 family flavoprotein [Pararhodobacter sp.]